MDAASREKVRTFCLIAAGICVLAGLGLACYPSFLEHTTGQDVTSTALRAAGQGKYQPLALDLEPAMNPIWLRWSAEVESSQRLKETIYSARLQLDGEAAWSGEFEIWTRRAKQSIGREEGSIGTVEVNRAGRYELVIERTGGRDNPDDVRDLSVAVKRNVHAAAGWYLPTGIGVIVTGFALFGLMILIEKKPQ
jgi:hypothetical protein